LEQVLFNLGIENSIDILDDRTLEILRDYQFLKFAPHTINNYAWKEAVILLNQLQPKLLF